MATFRSTLSWLLAPMDCGARMGQVPPAAPPVEPTVLLPPILKDNLAPERRMSEPTRLPAPLPYTLRFPRWTADPPGCPAIRLCLPGVRLLTSATAPLLAQPS